jgi:hypothetical protein
VCIAFVLFFIPTVVCSEYTVQLYGTFTFIFLNTTKVFYFWAYLLVTFFLVFDALWSHINMFENI